MREIKFRAFLDDYAYSDEYDSLSEFFDKNEGWDGIVFEQFTGLLDKNGTEIYEGDILSDGVNKSRRHWQKGHNYHVVDFRNGAFVGKGYNGEIRVSPNLENLYYRSEVIGNIYQNPELLK